MATWQPQPGLCKTCLTARLRLLMTGIVPTSSALEGSRKLQSLITILPAVKLFCTVKFTFCYHFGKSRPVWITSILCKLKWTASAYNCLIGRINKKPAVDSTVEHSNPINVICFRISLPTTICTEYRASIHLYTEWRCHKPKHFTTLQTKGKP